MRVLLSTYGSRGDVEPIAGRSVTDKLGIRYVYATFCPINLPSPHHPSLPLPGRPFPPEVTGNRALWDLEAQSRETSRPPQIGVDDL